MLFVFAHFQQYSILKSCKLNPIRLLEACVPQATCIHPFSTPIYLYGSTIHLSLQQLCLHIIQTIRAGALSVPCVCRASRASYQDVSFYYTDVLSVITQHAVNGTFFYFTEHFKHKKRESLIQERMKTNSSVP